METSNRELLEARLHNLEKGFELLKKDLAAAEAERDEARDLHAKACEQYGSAMAEISRLRRRYEPDTPGQEEFSARAQRLRPDASIFD